MRLREKVTQLCVEGSSESDDEEEAADDAWQPNSRDGSDADEAPVAERFAAPQADAAPRQLTHGDLSIALLRMTAKTHTPLCLSPEELTQDWARGGGFDVPALVCAGDGVAEALGMRLPPGLDSEDSAVKLLPRLFESLSPDTPVPVIDVETQSEQEPMSLADFVAYFTTTPRPSLLNVVSLSLAGTPLEATLCAPRVVREADLVARAWPSSRRDCPSVQLYALASPAGCVTDWHLDFGGSSVWYSIISGSKVFALAPPTTNNLRAYVQWASSSRQSRQFLGDALEDVHKYTVSAGELLLIPGGWPHAVYTPEDSLVVGGNFVHAANLGLQCLVWRIEDRLSVEASYRYPNFKALCWYAACTFMNSLAPAAGEDAAVAKAERIASKRLLVKLSEDGAAAAADGADAAQAGNLHFILSALKAEEEVGGRAEAAADGALDEAAEAADAADAPPAADAAEEAAAADAPDVVPAQSVDAGGEDCADAAAVRADADDEEAVAAVLADAAGEPCASDDDVAPACEAAGPAVPSTDEEAVAAALLGGAEAADAPAPSEPEPAAGSPPLTDSETLELVKLSAQLNMWLEQGGREAEVVAGVPADIEKPRSVLVRLQARLRAAGLEVAAIADSFMDEAEDITRGGTRMRFRVRTRNVTEPADGQLLELPALPLAEEDEDEEDDDEDDKPRKPRTKAAAKPAAGAKPVKRPAAAASVRDRLAKKLKLFKRR